MDINRRDKIRDLDIKLNVLNGESTASCKITAGRILDIPNGARFSLGDHTSVLCSILGPYEERRKRIKPTFAVYPNRLRLSVFIRPNCGSITNRYRSYEFIINKILQAIITTNTLPQCGLSFVIQIFNDSGSLLAHSINSCVIACIIGGIPIEFIPIAVSIGVSKNPIDNENQFILDPSNDDLIGCKGAITVVCDPLKDVILSINVDNGLCMLDYSNHNNLLELAMKGARYIREEIRNVCKNHWNHVNKLFEDNNN